MSQLRIGSLTGAVFGLLYVVLNAGPLSHPVAWALRLLAVVAFVGIVVLLRRPERGGAGAPTGSGADAFRTRGYRIVIVAEIVALVAGIGVLRGPVDAPNAVIGWVSFVVGVHFLALARVWRTPFFTLLGVTVAVCGAAGLIMAGAHAPRAAVAVVAGVVPGMVLLASAYRGVLGHQRT